MPGESTLVLKTRKTFVPYTPFGRKVIWETTNTDNGSPMAGGFEGVTGSTQGSSIIPDVTYNQTTAVTLEHSSGCPSSCLPYLERIVTSNYGTTGSGGNWALPVSTPVAVALTGIVIEDSNGYPLAVVPHTALQAQQSISLPVSQKTIPWTITGGTYSASAATYTATGSQLPGVAVTLPGRVISGTGQGQTFFATFTTSQTVLTFTLGALATALDTTSVLAFDYYVATTTSSTVLTQLNASMPTITAGQNIFAVLVTGSQAGQAGVVTATATNAYVTYAVGVGGTPTPNSLFVLTNNPSLGGTTDLAIANQLPAATLNSGLQAVVIGSPSAGNPVRLMWHGYYAYQ